MNRRTAVRAGVRSLVGVVALAIGAGAIAAATVVPIPTLSQTPAGRTVTPVALDQQRACPGSLLRLAGDSAASATTVTAQGTGGRVPQVAASQSQSVAEADLRGFAAAPCAEPTSSTWLVGGSTETGRTTLIDLVNPSDVNSTVDLSVAAENGKVDGPGLQGIVVAPRSQKVVPLSGFATGLASPVVHVTSRGGQIVATLQVGVVRTLEAGGADVVSGSAAPATEVVVPGIVIRDGAAVQAKAGQSGYEDLKAVLRAFVPGDKNAKLTVQVSTAEGTGSTFTDTVQGGQVSDISGGRRVDDVHGRPRRRNPPRPRQPHRPRGHRRAVGRHGRRSHERAAGHGACRFQRAHPGLDRRRLHVDEGERAARSDQLRRVRPDRRVRAVLADGRVEPGDGLPVGRVRFGVAAFLSAGAGADAGAGAGDGVGAGDGAAGGARYR